MKKLLLFINRNNIYITNKDGVLGDILTLLKKIEIDGSLSDIQILSNTIEFSYTVIKDTSTLTVNNNNVTNIAAATTFAMTSDEKITITITKKFGYYIITGNFDTQPNYLGLNLYGSSKNGFKYTDFSKYDWVNIKTYFIDLVDTKQETTYTKFNFNIKTHYSLIRDDKFTEMFEILENEEKNDKTE